MPAARSILRMKNDTEKLRKLISVLRGPKGCNWDRKQTPRSLAPLLIEEAYEVIEAVEKGTPAMFREEIGDLLFLLLSIVSAAESRKNGGAVRYPRIVEETVNKYVSRHPHVFLRRKDMTPDQILAQWEKIKEGEAGSTGHPLDKIPSALPALYQAKRLIDKAARLGILRVPKTSRQISGRQMGRRLLRLVHQSVRAGIDPETALRIELGRFKVELKKMRAARRR